MSSLADALSKLIFALAILLFFGPTLVIISLIGYIETAWGTIDLRKLGRLQRFVLAVVGITAWLTIYIPLVRLVWIIDSMPTPTSLPTSTPPTSDWPPDLITYYDFEADADLEGWQEGVERSNEHAFSGQYALKATLPVQADQETKISLSWQHEFTADVIVGQVYWPANEEVSIVWAQVCVPLEGWDCAGLLEKHGGWNTFVLDLSEMTVGDPPKKLNRLVLPGLHFQGGLRGTTGTNISTIPIYVDTIQIYRDGREDEDL